MQSFMPSIVRQFGLQLWFAFVRVGIADSKEQLAEMQQDRKDMDTFGHMGGNGWKWETLSHWVRTGCRM